MIRFNTLLEHQDTLTISIIKELILAGIGGTIYVYGNNGIITSKKIWRGHKIHLIKSDSIKRIYVIGGKHVALCSYDNLELTIINKFSIEDWILDVIQYTQSEILLLSSHNQVYLCDIFNGLVSCVKSTDEKCILYSGIFHRVENEPYVLSGTVFSETLVWKIDDMHSDKLSNISLRIKGHKGVIFSISARNIGSNKSFICTTSDDRTANIINDCSFENADETLDPLSLQGHCSRVWKSLLTDEHIYTIGEDSLLCSWSYDGTLIKKSVFSSCGGIRSISLGTSINNVLIGGCDGSIYDAHRDKLHIKPSSCLIGHNFGSVIPRKVAYSRGSVVCLADQSLFQLMNSQHCKVTELNYKCTDLSSSSCQNYFAISTACGRVILYHGDDANPEVYDVGNGKKCECVKWSNSSFMVQVAGGQLKLFKKLNDYFVLSSSLCLPKSKERSLTCFLRFNSCILIGDRMGNLHIYSEQETPTQSLYKLHSSQGISDIFERSDTVLTVGAGGKVNELGFIEGSMCLLRTFSIPMEMASKVINTTAGIVIAGFQGSYFQLWNLDHHMLLGDLKCGGGHRSFAFQLKDNYLIFVYIKNKQLFQASFPIVFGKVIRNSYHSKIINCLSAITGLQTPIIVSGSDDNTVRIVEIQNQDIHPIAIIEQHISSVRCLRIISLQDQQYLLISAGGREQLTFTKFNSNTRNCQELFSYLPKSPSADCRFMCLEVLKGASEKLIIFLGSSDCSIQIFTFDGTLEKIGILPYTHCLLQIVIIEQFLVSLSTNGEAVFWDIREFLSLNGPIPLSPTANFTLHQSGINSAVVKKRTCNQYLLATGGDDSLLKLTLFELSEKEAMPWRVISKWDIAEAHTCQITGLIFYESLLISTSIDQRLIVHKVLEKTHDRIETEILGETTSTVPDEHGVAVISKTSQSISVCVYGKGIEVIILKLDEFS